MGLLYDNDATAALGDIYTNPDNTVVYLNKAFILRLLMLQMGFTENEIDKIGSGNFRRLFGIATQTKK